MHPYTLLDLYRLRRSQWFTQPELERLQWVRLRRLIRHCYQKVPYYRKLFQSAGLKPDDIRGLSDLKLIPITTKQTLRHAPPEDVLPDGIRPRRSFERRTSGSTGTPIFFVLTPREKDAQDVVLARALMENGLRLADVRAMFYAPSHITMEKRWFRRLGIWRKAYFSVFDDIRDQMPELERLSPDSLAGIPAILKLIALEKLRSGSPRIAPRTIFSTADLLDQTTRRLLESAFDVEVTDLYASLELGHIAWECPQHAGYHVNMESVVLELLNDGRPASPGEAGEVVGTSLLSYTMPFLRYRLEDLCSLSHRPCPCGRGLPLLELVQGRANDAIRLPDGRVVAPQTVMSTLSKLGREIEQFRVVQESEDLVNVHLVKGAGFAGETLAMAEKSLREALGNEVRLEFNIVGHIDRDSSGKQRSVISKVSDR